MGFKRIISFLLFVVLIASYDLDAQDHYSRPEIIQCSKCKGSRTIKCKKCKGKGYKDKKGEKIECSKCETLGYKICEDCNGKGAYKIWYCLTCKACGILQCSWCHGNGTFGYESVKVSCPKCYGKKEYLCPVCERGPKGNVRGPLGKVTCTMCNDVKKIKCNKCDINGMVWISQAKLCSHCNGFKQKICRDCNGIGTVRSFIVE